MLDAQRTGSGGLAKLGEGVRANSDAKTQAGLTRGPNLSKKLINAAWTDTFPAQGATLDLDFANDRGFVRGIGQGKSMDAVTFTRASNGNYVKPDGTLSSHANQGALGNNLLTFPQDFDNAVWAKQSSTVTANAITSPDGTLTADALFETTANNIHGINVANIPVLTSSSYTYTLRVKANGRNYVLLYANQNNAGTYFDITAGTSGAVLGNYSGTAVTSSIQALDNDWFLCRLTFTTVSTASFIEAYASDNGTRISYSGDITKGIYIWGAQLELGSSATEYFPTNIGQPRFDWASTARINPVNLILYSQDFNLTAQWGVAATSVSANTLSVTDPLGKNEADKLIASASTAFHYLSGAFNTNNFISWIPASSNTYTFSVYMQAAEITSAALELVSSGSKADATFNLSTGVISANPAGSATITDIGGGWYRCSVTGINISGLSECRIYLNRASFTGNGVDGVYLWGAQLENSLSATDYKSTSLSIPITTPLQANPTSNGLLIEEARTNRILWCRDATQTQWVKTNVTAAKDQTGIDGVANAASSLTATANDGTCIQTITLASGSRTGSVYLKRITGTGNVQVSLDGTTYSTVDLSASEWRRIVLSGTVTNPTVGIKLAVSGDAVAMDYGQVEDGAFVTTPILTTTATATRSADVADILNVANTSWFNQDQGSIYAAAISLGSTALIPHIFSINRGAATPRIGMGRSGNGNNLQIFSNSTLSFSAAAETGVNINASMSFFVNTLLASAKGFDPIIGTSTQQNEIKTTFTIGGSPSGQRLWNGTIQQIWYAPVRLNENQLKAITK